MPDLTIHTARACSQTREWSREFPSSDGKSSYTVTWERNYSPDRVMEYHYTCTCWPWKKTPGGERKAFGGIDITVFWMQHAATSWLIPFNWSGRVSRTPFASKAGFT